MAQAFLAVRACYKYVILTLLLHWVQLSVLSAAGVLQLDRFYMLVTLLKYVAAVPLYREEDTSTQITKVNVRMVRRITQHCFFRLAT